MNTRKARLDLPFNTALSDRNGLHNVEYMIGDADDNIPVDFPCKRKSWEMNFHLPFCPILHLDRLDLIYMTIQKVIAALPSKDKRRTLEGSQAIYSLGLESCEFSTLSLDNIRGM